MTPRGAWQDIDLRVSHKLCHRFGPINASLHVARYWSVLHSLYARHVCDRGALTRRIELNVERLCVVRSRCTEREVYDFDHLPILPRRGLGSEQMGVYLTLKRQSPKSHLPQRTKPLSR